MFFYLLSAAIIQIIKCDAEWSRYLDRLDITSTAAVKLVTEAALLVPSKGGFPQNRLWFSDRPDSLSSWFMLCVGCIPNQVSVAFAYLEPQHNIAKISPKSPQTCGTIIKN